MDSGSKSLPLDLVRVLGPMREMSAGDDTYR